MNNVIDFTIKNLELRIEKVTSIIGFNKTKLKFAKRDGNNVLADEIEINIDNLENMLKGYKDAYKVLTCNLEMSDENIESIIKSLSVRKNKLNQNLELCNKALIIERQKLKTGQDTTVGVTPVGIVTMKFYKDISLSLVKKLEERVAKITKSLELCESAIKLFEKLKRG